jgi:hypothetical protein
MTAKDTPEIASLRKQLADLKHEADSLNERHAFAYAQLAEGSFDEQIEIAAKALIANPKTAVLTRDPETELRETSAQLAVNQKAQAILSKSLGVMELRVGFAAAKPLFDHALAYIPKMDGALITLEAIQREATAAIRAFEAVDPTGLAAQHPTERSPYNENALAPLRTWSVQLCGDGFNRSRLDLWRDDLRDLGLTRLE